MKNISNFVDGKLTDENPSNYISLFKPSTGEEYAHVPITSKEELKK
jgi:acyl-CoA reductase-like NAD-dependent aldehyde dehydrogenase